MSLQWWRRLKNTKKKSFSIPHKRKTLSNFHIQTWPKCMNHWNARHAEWMASQEEWNLRNDFQTNVVKMLRLPTKYALYRIPPKNHEFIVPATKNKPDTQTHAHRNTSHSKNAVPATYKTHLQNTLCAKRHGATISQPNRCEQLWMLSHPSANTPQPTTPQREPFAKAGKKCPALVLSLHCAAQRVNCLWWRVQRFTTWQWRGRCGNTSGLDFVSSQQNCLGQN